MGDSRVNCIKEFMLSSWKIPSNLPESDFNHRELFLIFQNTVTCAMSLKNSSSLSFLVVKSPHVLYLQAQMNESKSGLHKKQFRPG